MVLGKLVTCSVFLLVFLVPSDGHGGAFHAYPGTPEVRNDIRHKVGMCGPWVPLKQATVAAADPMPIVSGPATLWTYRYKNCSDSFSVCVEVNLTLTQAGQPVVGKIYSAYSHVKSCNEGAGARYKLNASITDAAALNRTYVWFHDATTNSSGRFWGQGANDGFLSTAAPGGLASYVLYEQSTQAPVACCDFQFSAPKDTNWSSLLAPGVTCGGDPHAGHAGHNGGSTKEGMDTMSNGTQKLTTSTGFTTTIGGAQLLAVVGLLLLLL